MRFVYTLSFPFPAVILLISVFRCSRKLHLFLETLSSLNFHEETSVWKQLWDATACTQPNGNHGRLPTMLLAIWHEEPTRWINLLRNKLCYKWVTSDGGAKLSDATLRPCLNRHVFWQWRKGIDAKNVFKPITKQSLWSWTDLKHFSLSSCTLRTLVIFLAAVHC